MKRSFLNRTRLARVALGALLASTGLAQPVAAQRAADWVLREFELTSEWIVVVGGQPVPAAEVYESGVANSYLVITPGLTSAVVLARRTQNAEGVAVANVQRRADGKVDLSAGATLTPFGKLQVVGDDVVFQAEGKEVRFRPKPPLLGKQTRSGVLAHSPSYAKTGERFTPDERNLARIKAQAQPVSIRIFFGSWCPHCRHYVPHALKLEQLLAGSKVSFDYFGINRSDKGGFQEPEAVRNNIKGVPTAIVYVGGREVGRIMNDGWLNLDATVAKLVAGVVAPAAGTK
jgi:thiol-disulfide isomerase/thioredoxin